MLYFFKAIPTGFNPRTAWVLNLAQPPNRTLIIYCHLHALYIYYFASSSSVQRLQPQYPHRPSPELLLQISLTQSSWLTYAPSICSASTARFALLHICGDPSSRFCIQLHVSIISLVAMLLRITSIGVISNRWTERVILACTCWPRARYRCISLWECSVV